MDDLLQRSLMLEALDRQCDQFESDFLAGHAPRIEELLTVVDPALRPNWRRCLLEIELELRVKRGDRPTLDEYLTRFPDARETIYSVFAAVCPEVLDLPTG